MNDAARDEEELALELPVWGVLRKLDAEFALAAKQARSEARRPELWQAYLEERAKLEAVIEELTMRLEQALPEGTRSADAHEPSWKRCLAAVLIYYDERELRLLSALHVEHPPRLWQTRYCQIYDGGERFFSYLEDALRSPATPPLVLRVFLYCLRSGYQGKYAEWTGREGALRDDDSTQPEREDDIRVARAGRDAYLSELRARVAPKESLAVEQSAPRRQVARVHGVGFPYTDYLIALAVVLAVYLGLKTAAASHQNEHPDLVECRQ